MIRSLIVLFFTLTSVAQTAKVVALSKEDATRVKAAFDKIVAAQAEYDNLKKSVEVHYLQVSENDPERGNCFVPVLTSNIWPSVVKNESPKYWRKGFDDYVCGSWEFSEDFHFIVPVHPYQPIRAGNILVAQ